MAFDLFTTGATLLGAALGGQEQTKEGPQLDARIAKYIYGEDGKSGIVKDAADVYKAQMATGGLNQNQQAGLNYLQQFYTSPMLNNGYNSMAKASSGILDKYASKFGNDNFQAFKPNIQTTPVTNTDPFQFAQQSTPSGSPVTLSGVPGGSGGGGVQPSTGGSQTGTPGGQGVNLDVAKAALQAMAVSENPAIRALSPTIAALLGVGGSVVAGQQADAMGEAGNKLAASAPLSQMGIGTVSDANGNVRTYSSPETIAAADARMLGYQPGWDSSPSANSPQMSGGLLRQTNGNLNSMGGAQGLTGNINGPGYGFQGNGGLGLKGGW